MRPTVHLRPDRLRAHATAAAELTVGLRAVLGGRPGFSSSGLDGLETTLHRALRELAELAVVLVAAAEAAEWADADAARAVRRVSPR